MQRVYGRAVKTQAGDVSPAKLRSVVNSRPIFRIWSLPGLCFVPRVDNYNWAKIFRELFQDGLEAYRAGRRDAQAMFNAEQVELLKSIGATPQEIFDFVEDTFHGGDPGFETALLVTAVRRDYFMVVQMAQRSGRLIDMDKLPAKAAQLDGIEWLPRIIEKAHAKLRGEMPSELMYCCGGDRAFLREHGIHPADFLREVWAAGDDKKRILEFVRRSAADVPPDLPPVFCQILPDGRVKC